MSGQTNKCHKCSKEKKLKKYNGQCYCNKCYNKYCKPQKQCVDCGKITYVEKYEKHGPVCSTCYLKYKKKELCYICNEMDIVGKRTKNGAACKKCYNKFLRKVEKCIICNKLKIVNFRSNDGPICKSCYKTPKDTCSICGKTNNVRKRIDNLCICKNCYFKYKYDNDNRFKVLHKLRSRIQLALKTYLLNGKTKSCEEYGIKFEDIINYLGNCPGNKEDYHIDHIFPLAAFDFNNSIHIKAAFAPENHQWLVVKENLQKNNKYDQKEFDEYIKKFED